MKTRSKITAFITAILLTAVFAGCKHNAMESLGDIETRKPEVDVYATINGTITNYAEIIIDKVTQNDTALNASMRTIAPALKTSDYKFFLYGQNGASFCGPFELTGELTGNGGSFECSVPTGIWNLSLVAFKSDMTFAGGATTPSRTECQTGFADTALLIGKSYVDLTAATVLDVNFVLSPEGLSTKGKVGFSIVLDGWKSLDKPNVTAKAGIYNLKTGEEIKYGETSTVKTVQFTAAGTGGKDAEDGIFKIPEGTEYTTYELKNGDTSVELAPGTYSFFLTFTDSKTKKSWVWNDTIMIFPGITVDKTVSVPRLIFEKPKAPEYLYASVNKKFGSKEAVDHVTDDISKYKPITDDSGRLYQVVFDWADWDKDGVAINNEKYFELQLADVTGIKDGEIANATTEGADKADKVWKYIDTDNAETDLRDTYYVAYTKEVLDLDANDKYQYKSVDAPAVAWELKLKDDPINAPAAEKDDPAKDDLVRNVSRYSTGVFSAIPTYVDGSLNANNKTITLYLELGKEYIARIAAVNDTDRSDWTYCKLTADTDVHLSAGATDKAKFTLSGIGFKGETINNYYVRYMLNGGTGKNVSGNYVEYFGPAAADGTEFADFFKNGKENADKTEGLSRGGVYVTGWKDGPESNARDYYISKPTASTTKYAAAVDATSPYTKKVAKTIEQTLYNGTKISKVINLYSKAASPTAPTDEAPNETGWVTITTDPPKTTTKSADADSMITYAGSENLTLWAQYAKEFTWNFITNYDLDPSWVKYQVVDSTGATIDVSSLDASDPVKTLVPTLKEYADGGTTIGGNLATGAYSAEYHPQMNKDYTKIKWMITVPADTKWNYRYAKVTINRSDVLNQTVTLAESETASVGTATVLTTDVADLVQGTYYNVLIEMGLPNSSLVTTLPVVLYVR